MHQMASSQETSLNPVFADVSVLVEYCSIYFEEHHFAAKVLDEYYDEGGKIVVSEKSWLGLNSKMTNRERLWNHLLDKATEYMKDDDLGAAEFRSDILNYTSLEQNLDFHFHEEFLADVRSLREEFNEHGFEEFRELIDDSRIQGNIQRRELENGKDLGMFHRGGSRGSWMASSQIGQYTITDSQTSSLMDYGYWRRENNGALLLGSMSKTAESIDELADAIESVANNEPTILTPKKIVEETSIFS